MKSKFFVPFETAKLLKKKGYPQEWSDWYYHENIDKTFMLVSNQEVPQGLLNGRQSEFNFEYITAAPTYHEVLDWLEENGIYITTLWNIGETDKEDTYEILWKCFVDITLHEEQVTSVYHTREEAINEGILKALEML